MAGHTSLVEQDRTVGINPARDQRRRHFTRVRGELGRFIIHGDRMEIGEELKSFAVNAVLHRHPIADRAEIIAEVEISRWLNAGDDAHDWVFL